MKESTIESEVCAYAEAKGALVRKFVSPGHRGVPDRLFIWPWGETVYVEFKAKNGRLNPHQQREHHALRKQRCIVWIIYSIEAGKILIDIYCAENSL